MIIIQDTKEKMPWHFDIYDCCDGQVVQSLKTGDYTVKGYESLICLERKRTVGEIAINLGSKVKQFKAEFERMSTFRFRFIICEFPSSKILEFPRGSGIPQRVWPKLRINGKYIFSLLHSLCDEFSVDLHFCDCREDAELLAIQLLENTYETIKREN